MVICYMLQLMLYITYTHKRKHTYDILYSIITLLYCTALLMTLIVIAILILYT